MSVYIKVKVLTSSLVNLLNLCICRYDPLFITYIKERNFIKELINKSDKTMLSNSTGFFHRKFLKGIFKDISVKEK